MKENGEGHKGQITEGNKSHITKELKLPEVAKSQNLNDVVQRMLKVKQKQENTLPRSHEINQSQDNMIDVQFATASENAISGRCFGEIKQEKGQDNFAMKMEPNPPTAPFIPTSILNLQKSQNENQPFVTSDHSSPKSNSSEHKSSRVNSPTSSTTSGKDEDPERSMSPPMTDEKSNRASFPSPTHPSVCSLVSTPPFSQYNHQTSTARTAMTSPGVIDNAGADKDAMYRTYRRELMKKMSNGSDVSEPASNPAPKDSPSTTGRYGRGKKTEPVARNADGKPTYKRPPHTYPALIASAILDSPGNLITLRGIYDYIMNNFPYYKYCHDKSAWQNSIRHNLSLNQCFVKVPRYENAAKSNFWTMTHDGFEEFGNENSFKRRRRRGATLAPISAYKNKKVSASTEEIENGKGGKHKQSIYQQNNSLQRDSGWLQHAMSNADQTFKNKSNLIEVLKRTRSTDDDNLIVKHPRMMVLKQGDGPKIYKQSDQQARPNSLSSVEEMQGNLNSFSQTLSTAKDDQTKLPRYMEQDAYDARAAQQQWLIAAAAAQKNLFGLTTNAASMAAAGMFPSYLVPQNISPKLPASRSPPMQNSPPSATEDAPKLTTETSSVYIDDVEIGTKMSSSSSDNDLGSFQCRFCDFKCMSDNASGLRQHCQILHRQDIYRMQADSNKQRGSPQTIQGPTSHPTDYTTSTVRDSPPTSHAYLSGLQTDSMMRTLVQQGSIPSLDQYIASSGSGADLHNNVQKQQLLALLHQAAVANTQGSQDQNIRQFLYQQMLLHNSLLASNPGFQSIQTAQGTDSIDQSTLSKIMNYQKLRGESPKHDEMKNEDVNKNTGYGQPLNNGSSFSSDDTAEVDDPGIHRWRKCTKCDFRAKGAHGLELHYRKSHPVNASSSYDKNSAVGGSEPWQVDSSENSLKKIENIARKVSTDGFSDSPTTGYHRSSSTCSTQTDPDRSRDRTCQYCDVTFGDDMMHALHMSCHDKSSPYTCTICGQNCHEKYYFNVHLLRGLHTPKVEAKSADVTSLNDKEEKPTRRFSEQNEIEN